MDVKDLGFLDEDDTPDVELRRRIPVVSDDPVPSEEEHWRLFGLIGDP